MDKRFEYPKDDDKDREALAAQVRRDQHHTTYATTEAAKRDIKTATEVDIERDAARGLARCDATALAQLRQIILSVIDNRDPATGVRWQFEVSDYSNDPLTDDLTKYEAKANEQRLRFCDAIEAEIIRRAVPAAAKADDVNGGK